MTAYSPTAAGGYTTASRWLHWITALLVLATIPAGVVMVTEGISRPLQNSLFIFHKNVGVIILLLVIARLAMRLVTSPGPLPDSVPPWQRRAAAVSHGALYLLLIVMAVSGYVRVVAGGFPLEMLDAIGAPRAFMRRPGSCWPRSSSCTCRQPRFMAWSNATAYLAGCGRRTPSRARPFLRPSPEP